MARRLTQADFGELETLQREAGLDPVPSRLLEIEILQAWSTCAPGNPLTNAIVYGVTEDNRELRVLSLAVKKETRRLGAGKELARHALQVACKYDLRRVTFECRPKNEAVRKLGESFGASVAFMKNFHFPTGNPEAVVYCLSVSPEDTCKNAAVGNARAEKGSKPTVSLSF